MSLDVTAPSQPAAKSAGEALFDSLDEAVRQQARNALFTRYRSIIQELNEQYRPLYPGNHPQGHIRSLLDERNKCQDTMLGAACKLWVANALKDGTLPEMMTDEASALADHLQHHIKSKYVEHAVRNAVYSGALTTQRPFVSYK